jgi:hypothetical protein
MSIGPSLPAGAAGSPLAQTSGTELDRAQKEVGARRRRVYHEQQAESAAGVGETDGEGLETHQRDADGRRNWEEQPGPEPDSEPPVGRQSKDPTRQSGNLLDLTG